MAKQSPAKGSTPRTITTDLIEEAALLRTLGANFGGADLGTANRVEVSFVVSEEQEDALAAFRRGLGPPVSASEFSAGLSWARTIIFAARRNRDRGMR